MFLWLLISVSRVRVPNRPPYTQYIVLFNDLKPQNSEV